MEGEKAMQIAEIVKCIEWQQADPKHRTLDIKFDGSEYRPIKVYVYDRKLMASVDVTCPEDLDNIERIKIETDRRAYERLKAQFEEATV